ncbi:MAG: TIGR03667 family PPOX class F420-dependent oxidoreductase [Gaiellales bacterium]
MTVTERGVPQPSPVWFLLDGESFLVYSRPGAPKLRNIGANPRVALHLNDDGTGGDVVVVSARAAQSDDPPADQVPAYVEKYLGLIEGNNWTPASFAADYSVPIRIAPTRVRGH